MVHNTTITQAERPNRSTTATSAGDEISVAPVVYGYGGERHAEREKDDADAGGRGLEPRQVDSPWRRRPREDGYREDDGDGGGLGGSRSYAFGDE
jgi:hypothetical protein